ncbi:class I SAM-dependent methyltransferase [Kitasatospora acidiphila]|uniref:class I SAM-dependent methyltransferase n=1 Tax=Kitasatospora acidiphila TaxID=2567942 RepID=UPI003C760B36
MAKLRTRELMLGIEGLALLREAASADDQFVEARLREIRSLLEPGRQASSSDVVELDVATGYAAWAASYDSLPSSVIQVEEPLVHRIIDRVPTGTAVDAACGTGRHAAALLARGHRTIGVDQSAEMLAVAEQKAPAGDFRVGSLEKLPLDDASADLAICALALTHLSELGSAVAELARVVRPGGKVVISDVHPMMVLLQGQGGACFAHGPRRLAVMHNHVHLHADYLTAFAAAGLGVDSCQEPRFNGEFPPGGFEERIADAARAAWQGVPSAVVWELTRLP